MPDSAFKATVLQVVPELDTGGVEQTTVDMAEAILAAGGTSIVVSKGGRLAARLQKGGTTLVTLPVHSKNPLVQLANHFALRQLIRKHRIDIVHVRSRAPALAALGAACAEKVMSVATYAGVYNARSGLKRWYNSQMTRADMTIANSDFTRAHILATYSNVLAERVIAIPRGIDLKRFDPEAFEVGKIMKFEQAWGAREHTLRFLLAGRLTRWKGQALIIEACKLLQDRGAPDFQVFMAGDDQGRGNYRAELQSMIDRYDLGENVRLVGHVDDMAAAYTLCHFALAPSLEPEAFGRTAVEPQAMLRPPLASAHGATAETISDGVTGWLVTPGDARAWADAMERAMALSEDERFAMGKRGRERVKAEFSLDVMCARTLEVYRALLILMKRRLAGR